MPGVIAVAGATGLVGRECLRLASRDANITRVVALVRRFVHPSAQPQKVEYQIVDFDRLAETVLPTRVDAVLCALGTTMRQAGSRQAFRQVDHDYVVALARRGLEWGASHFLMVSSAGARADSRFFYQRVKGEVEAAIGALSYRAITIARPSFLLGHRAEARFGEGLGQRLAAFLPERYRPVEASRVAAALVAAATSEASGQRVLDNLALRRQPLPRVPEAGVP